MHSTSQSTDDNHLAGRCRARDCAPDLDNLDGPGKSGRPLGAAVVIVGNVCGAQAAASGALMPNLAARASSSSSGIASNTEPCGLGAGCGFNGAGLRCS